MRLPPLNALRVFEAAARHLSFTRAADELHVTQAAVSHQIKLLEEDLGVALFRRLHRRLLLTDEGQQLLPSVRAAFDELVSATRRLRTGEREGVLTVSAVPSFAACWLVPRIGRFRAVHPEIDLRIAASMQVTDFAREDVDVGLRYGSGRYPDLHTCLLMHEEFFPVCNPTLLGGGHPIYKPDDLRHHVLLHDEFEPHDSGLGWSDWLKAAGAKGVNAERGPRFGDAAMMVQAAIGGLGVAMGRTALVMDALAQGVLVRPFDLALPSSNAYWIVCAPANADKPKIRAFREWLLAEASAGLAQN